MRSHSSQTKGPDIKFQQIHYAPISSVEVSGNNSSNNNRLPFGFVTSGEDGYVSFWDMRKDKAYKYIQFKDERVTCMKAIRNFSQLIVAH